MTPGLQCKPEVKKLKKTPTGLTYQGQPRTFGFRFSRTDGVALAVCLVSCLTLWGLTEGTIVLFPVVLGHFFLFCNVFRIARRLEYIWSGVFLVNYLGWALSGGFSWLGVLVIQTPVTISLILLMIRSPWYHGIFAGKWNRDHLRDYLAGRL
jgi:hypothetical protein